MKTVCTQEAGIVMIPAIPTESTSMANMKEVNKAIKAAYPDLKVELVRGDCYAYFAHADDTYEVFPPIMSHPPVTPTDAMIRMALDTISIEIKEQKAHEQQASGVCSGIEGSGCVLGASDDCVRGSCGSADPNPVESGPESLKEGDRIATLLGGHRVVYVITGDAEIGKPTPARIERWVNLTCLSLDLVIDESGDTCGLLERSIGKAAESIKTGKQLVIDEMIAGGRVLLIGPGHRGSSKTGALRDYQRGMFDQALREASDSIRSTHAAQSRGQKRWNRRTMGYRNGY